MNMEDNEAGKINEFLTFPHILLRWKENNTNQYI